MPRRLSARHPSRASTRAGDWTGVQRWIALTLGLAVAAVSLYVLAQGGGEQPLGQIDAASRDSLQRVLREADRQ